MDKHLFTPDGTDNRQGNSFISAWLCEAIIYWGFLQEYGQGITGTKPCTFLWNQESSELASLLPTEHVLIWEPLQQQEFQRSEFSLVSEAAMLLTGSVQSCARLPRRPWFLPLLASEWLHRKQLVFLFKWLPGEAGSQEQWAVDRAQAGDMAELGNVCLPLYSISQQEPAHPPLL